MMRAPLRSIRKVPSTIKEGFALVESGLSNRFAIHNFRLVNQRFCLVRRASITNGARTRAGMLADEGLEAVRNIRDENFTNLTDALLV